MCGSARCMMALALPKSMCSMANDKSDERAMTCIGLLKLMSRSSHMYVMASSRDVSFCIRYPMRRMERRNTIVENSSL